MTFSFGFSFANLGDDRVDLVLPGVNGDDRWHLPAAFDHWLAVVLPMERRFHLVDESLRPQGITSD